MDASQSPSVDGGDVSPIAATGPGSVRLLSLLTGRYDAIMLCPIG